MAIIALITDFGTKDWFAAEMKGVIFSITKNINIVDITHEIPAGNLQTAAFVLLASHSSFPPQTIFCVAAGNPNQQCRSIAVQTEDYIFIGPDNGILSWAVNKHKSFQAWCVENKEYARIQTSTTFQARDVLVPAAAYIAEDVPICQLGHQIYCISQIPFPEPDIDNTKVQGEIIYIDKYGNGITNIEIKKTQLLNKSFNRCVLNSRHSIVVRKEYQDVKKLEGLCYQGSAGFFEIGVREGNGESVLEMKTGQKVELYLEANNF